MLCMLLGVDNNVAFKAWARAKMRGARATFGATSAMDWLNKIMLRKFLELGLPAAKAGVERNKPERIR